MTQFLCTDDEHIYIVQELSYKAYIFSKTNFQIAARPDNKVFQNTNSIKHTKTYQHHGIQHHGWYVTNENEHVEKFVGTFV